MSEPETPVVSIPRGPRPRRPEAAAPPFHPRERLRAHGVGRLSDAELLALVLGSGVAGRSVARIARRLARRRADELARWPLARWMLTPGIGLARAAAMVA